MRVTAPEATARFGNVEIRGVQSVVELEALESSYASDHHNIHQTPSRSTDKNSNKTQAVSPSTINFIQSRTAIVVPCKDEALDHIKGVWAAIPASSLIILVSGSEPDSYALERAALTDFCATTGRRGISIHQRDPKVAHALRTAGLPELLDEAGDGLVYKGKGEGLVLGIALAAIARGPSESGTDGTSGYYKYIGFVDADNFVPGSVQEYCRAFSAGMHLAQAEDAMVRINWSSKPKVENGKLHFKPSGRSSEIVNRWLNRLLNNMDTTVTNNANQDQEKAAATNLICTGNAGEHAMTISLALKLRVASGYAIEPFHFLDIFERFADDSEKAASGQNKQEQQLRESSDVAGPTFDEQLSDLPMSPEASFSGTPLESSPFLSACEESTMPTSPSASYTALDKVPSIKRLPPALSTMADYKKTLAQSKTIDDFTPPDSPVSPPAKVQILQIRTINPHFHDNKGDAHVVRMWKQGLSVIYHSSVASTFTQYREELRAATFGGGEYEGVPTPPFSTTASVATSPSPSTDDTVKDGAVIAAADWQPAKCRIYPSPGSMDLGKLRNKLENEEGSFWWSGMDDELRAAAGKLDSVPGLSIDLLGLGPVNLDKRPENDVDGFKECVDAGR